MKINQIIMEEIDHASADQAYRGLKAAGEDLTAFYFQQERLRPFHTLETAIEAARSHARRAEDAIEKQKQNTASTQAAHNPSRSKHAYLPPKEYSDAFRGNQYVKVARKELPPELKQFLPILDKGLFMAMSSGWQAGKKISGLLNK